MRKSKKKRFQFGGAAEVAVKMSESAFNKLKKNNTMSVITFKLFKM